MYFASHVCIPIEADERHSNEWRIPSNCRLASSSDYVDSDLFLKWLEHFVRFANSSKENSHIAILDGHHSLKTLSAVGYIHCRANGIHRLTLPPHSTHKMQPLDHPYSKTLKSAFNRVTDNYNGEILGIPSQFIR